MIKRILGILSYVGMRPGLRSIGRQVSEAGVGSVRDLRRVERSRARRALHARPVARDRRLLPAAQRALRRDRERQRPRLPRHPRRRELPVHAPKQAVGPHGEQAVQPVRADGEAAAGPEGAGEVHGVRSGSRTSTASGRVSRATSTTRSRCRSNTSTPTSRPVQTKQYNVDTYGTVVIEYMGRTERVDDRLRAGPHQRADQAAESAAAEGLLPERARREGPGELRPTRATAASPTR